MRTSRRHVVVAAATVAALVLAAPAAAYLCHKDPPGTRVLFVHGSITSYDARGARVELTYRTQRGCRTVVWDAERAAAARTARSSCAARRRLAFAPTRLQVEVTPNAAPLLIVRDPSGMGHRWALPARPRAVAASGDLAVFSALGGGGLYAVRLSDGKSGLIGPNRPTDVPRLTPAGVFFQDDEFKRDRASGVTRLKFVPTAGIASIIDRAQSPLETNGRITALAMDGPRVALAVTDPQRRCDRVLYWNVAWRPVQRISAPNGPTCASPQQTAISRVAIAGFRAAWLRPAGGAQAVVAGSPKCQEWIIRRLQRGSGHDEVVGLAGDREILAFAVTRHERELRGTSEVALVSGRFRAVDLIARREIPTQLVADRGRIAVLWDDGTVQLLGQRGRILRQFAIGRAVAIALAGDKLVAVRDGKLDVYSVSSRSRVAQWPVPSDVRGVDLQYGLAVLHTPRRVLGVRVDSGQTSLIARSPRTIVNVQVEAAGLAYAYNVRSHGIVRFIPIDALQAAAG